MIEMRLADVAAVTGGRLHRASGDERVTAVEFDSRSAGPGTLFLTLPGARVDGHDFVPAVMAAGATGVLTARELDAPGVVVPLGARSDDTYLGAADPDGSGAGVLLALAALARHQIANLPGLRTVGITGSAGKTSTKDLVAALLAPLGPLVAPPGSFNTELGMPWTALRADENTRTLVLEYSARRAGHIAGMARVVAPDVAVVLNVGSAHLDEFGSVEGIAQAKGELVEALTADGVAVLNADDPAVRAMAERTKAAVVLVGEAADATIRAENVRLDGAGRASYSLVTPTGAAPVQLAVAGRHQVGNTLAAAAVALELGATVTEVAAALADLRLVSTRRMDVFTRADGVTVIDDSYNANPGSMAAALHALADMRTTGRRVAVLGYMAELGGYERAGHEEVGRLAAQLGVDLLVVVGEPAAPIHDGAVAVPEWGGTSVRVGDQEEAVALLRGELSPGDFALVKGSRYRTWAVVDALRAQRAGVSAPVAEGERTT